MSTDAENFKTLQQAIFATQKLRESVKKTFTRLTDGVKTSPDGSNAERNVKQFVSQLQLHLYSINDNFSELEKFTNSLSKLSQGSSIGMTGLLSLDPVLDKTPLYQQVIQSYKWSSKLKEHSSHALTLLNNHTFKRSSGIALKRRKMQSNLMTLSPQAEEQMISSIKRQFQDIMIITKVPHLPNVYQVTLGRTLHAVLGLRRLLIERVVVRGQHEFMNLDDRMIDIWASSKYEVFQKITDHATSAMLHYHLPLRADICFRSFMTWLRSYQKLFSTPCRHCGYFLVNNLPPTWHDFRTLQPYHEGCRL